ncbi:MULTISPECIES: acetyltransferase [Rhizobium/Agrobacterium group]|uniref:acetyltransferase n=1 Tax=Rhizobium/Agrobacterium group TaxID=227290 RepID=UPI00056F013E|nr:MULTISPECIES: acetyltransferase [Rhizobium/Agrobacterium group]AKC10079.1 sugar O-acyltransferase [Agrobacterium tumefaciens]AYM19223.1 hypothetical protein At15955_42380 [Agrobacterium tumefaciens]AYM70524.1 hypothetical protein AtA6_43080 [Agrobacterium tumefaciens]MDH7808121.1 sugar O-acyltransferase (sialic acid O-acetyltransferase NeuD family) [Rhizobium sp. AN67]MDQ4405097.1 acetyltransferase [Rhizobium sp. AN63]
MFKEKLIIVGDSAFAEVAYEYFSQDSEYEVIGFAVERAYRTKTELFGLPIFVFEELPDIFGKDDVKFYVAIVYSQLNRLRTRLYKAAKDMGYQPASYISSRAFVWHNAQIGEHCFIMEHNTVQPFVSIGDNVVLWSGNHVGHHTKIQNNVFVSSHVVISGFCYVGENCFLGVNSAIANNVTVAADNWLGPSVTISSNTQDGQLFRVDQDQPTKVSALRFFKVAK